MDKGTLTYKKLSKLLEIQPGEGKHIVWYLKGEKEIYKKLFLLIYKKIDRINEFPICIPQSNITKELQTPQKALEYPFYKFQDCGLITIIQNEGRKFIVIHKNMLANWKDACEELEK